MGLKYIVGRAVDWGLAGANHVRDVKPLKAPPGRVRYLDYDQVAVLLEACPEWLRPIVVVSMNTGLRRSEVLYLKQENLDFGNRLIILESTKTNERRITPMNGTAYEALLPYRSADSGYVFSQAGGEPYSATNATTAFRRAARRAGLKDFRLHDLRHHFASWLAMSGHGLRTIQELLGHKDPKMTMRYAHLSSDYLKQAVEDLDRLAQNIPRKK